MRIFNLLNSFFVNRGKQFVTCYDDDDELHARRGMFVTMCRNFVRGEHHAFRHWVCLVYQYNTYCFVLHKLKIAFCKIALEWTWIGIGIGTGLELDWIGNHHPYGLEHIIILTDWKASPLRGWNASPLRVGTTSS